MSANVVYLWWLNVSALKYIDGPNQKTLWVFKLKWIYEHQNKTVGTLDSPHFR